MKVHGRGGREGASGILAPLDLDPVAKRGAAIPRGSLGARVERGRQLPDREHGVWIAHQEIETILRVTPAPQGGRWRFQRGPGRCEPFQGAQGDALNEK